MNISSNTYTHMTDEMLKQYIPKIYQHDIFSVDYEMLKKHGIKLISFDIDDTIIPLENRFPKDKELRNTVVLFNTLRSKGIKTMLISNANEERTQKLSEMIGTDYYISRAEKPKEKSFSKALEMYKDSTGESITYSQMVHIGNDMITDIGSCNSIGITTCLVRRVGIFSCIPSKLNLSEGKKLREELKKRKLWYKHHQNEKNDQYYQLGEIPKYKK